jgi:hypothetical protein
VYRPSRALFLVAEMARFNYPPLEKYVENEVKAGLILADNGAVYPQAGVCVIKED